MRLVALLVIGWGAAPGQDTHFLTPGTFEDRKALILSNDKLELTVLTEGGALASLVLRDDPGKLSPLWNPARFARESGQKFSGFTLGHFVCVDGFGPVSKEEQAAGMPGHGEAHTLPWEVKSSSKEGPIASVTFSVRLPLVEEILTRTIRMVDGENVIHVESELESLLSFDRPLCWAEHATIGSPFLEPGVTVVDMSASRAKTRPYEAGSGGLPHRLVSGQDFTWPNAPAAAGSTVDLRAAPPNPNTGDHTTCLMDPARRLVFVTALHPKQRLLLGYLFRREEFPWTQNWENYPRNLKMARGLEFSTQPFDVPRREVIQMNTLFDTPVYRWLPARSKVGSHFLLFYARTPEGFRKVDDVKLEGGKLTVEDRGAGKRLVLPASLAL